MDQQVYLSSLLEKYSSDKIEINDPRLMEVKSIIRHWSGKNLREIFLTGSNSKRTSIKESTHCDLLISLKNHQVDDLPNLYKSLEYEFVNYGIKPSRHTNSIFLESNGLKIEVIPAVFKNGTLNYHSIYYEPIKQVLETNITLHDNHILESKFQKEIKLLKIWRKNHQLRFPTLFLELSVLKVMNRKKSDNLATNFFNILKHIEQEIMTNDIVDPANSDHKVSDLISKEEKAQIQEQAKKSLETENIQELIW